MGRIRNRLVKWIGFVLYFVLFFGISRNLYQDSFRSLRECLYAYWRGFTSVNLMCLHWLLFQLPVWIILYGKQIEVREKMYQHILVRNKSLNAYRNKEQTADAVLIFLYYAGQAAVIYICYAVSGNGQLSIGQPADILYMILLNTITTVNFLLFLLILYELGMGMVPGFATGLAVLLISVTAAGFYNAETGVCFPFAQAIWRTEIADMPFKKGMAAAFLYAAALMFIECKISKVRLEHMLES